MYSLAHLYTHAHTGGLGNSPKQRAGSARPGSAAAAAAAAAAAEHEPHRHTNGHSNGPALGLQGHGMGVRGGGLPNGVKEAGHKAPHQRSIPYVSMYPMLQVRARVCVRVHVRMDVPCSKALAAWPLRSLDSH